MTHLAFQKSLEGSHVEWMEHVPDDIYAADPENSRIPELSAFDFPLLLNVKFSLEK